MAKQIPKGRLLDLLKQSSDSLTRMLGWVLHTSPTKNRQAGEIAEYRNPALLQWTLETRTLIERAFGADSGQLATFKKVYFSLGVFVRASQDGYVDSRQLEHDFNGLRKGYQAASALLASLVTEVQQFWEDDQEAQPANSQMDRLSRVFRSFRRVIRQLGKRHGGRPSFEVNDEYDVQDLLHAILLIDYDDVREEEWTPSYAGASSRADFLLKREQVVIEVKMTRKGLAAKEIGEQLIIDVQRYQAHPDCKTLVCFVYDPVSWISNPKGIIADLESRQGLPVKVFIEPHH
jgi:hypothetical protein